jgi:hypothetical protein
MKRVLLIVNKSWEAEPILSALLDKKFRPAQPGDPTFLDHPRKTAQGQACPRATWQLTNYMVELWCIENIMEPNPGPQTLKGYYSSSEQKNKDLKKIFSWSAMEVALVAAIGTAAYHAQESVNGSIVIGSSIFIYDGHPAGDENPESKWHDAAWFQKLVTSSVNEIFFTKLNAELNKEENKKYFKMRMLRPPLMSPDEQQIICDKELLALSNVNVTDYTEYEIMDKRGLQALEDANTGKTLGSLETTHGVIRANAGDAPFIFISAIVDRVGYFASDVAPKEMAQNFSGSFNAGIFTGFLIAQLENVL